MSPGFRPSWPETKTKPPAAIACEYGAPWNGAGAASVRTTRLVAHRRLLSLACLGQRGAEPLEDRLEHVTAVGAVEEPHVEHEPRVLGEHLEEAARDVGAEPADAGLREVDVRDEERLVARLEHDGGERLRRRHGAGAVTACALGPQRPGERVPERRRRGVDLGLRVARLDVEDEIEPRGLGEAREQPVEDGKPRLDRRVAVPVDVDANACRSLLAHPAERSSGRL